MITIEVLGTERMITGLEKVEHGLTSLRPLWELYGQEFYGQEKRLFALAPWTPLSPAYAKRKAAKYPGKGILRATDRLFHSLTGKGADGNVHRVDDDGAEFGSAVPYGVFHALSRPPLAEPDIGRYDTIAGKYVGDLIREAGFA